MLQSGHFDEERFPTASFQMQNESPKPTEEEGEQKPEEDKNLDRDGGNRQPTDHSGDK